MTPPPDRFIEDIKSFQRLVVRHGLRGSPFEVECVWEVEAKDGDTVEHCQSEQGHTRARREHVGVFAPVNENFNWILVFVSPDGRRD